MKRSRRPETIHGAISSIFRSMPDSRRKRESLLVVLWPRVVGSLFAAHTRIVSYESPSTITVEIDNPSWGPPIKQSERHILTRLNNEFDDFKISAIRFKLAETGSNREESVPKPEEEKISYDMEQLPPELQRELKSIEDEELKGMILRTYINLKKRKV